MTVRRCTGFASATAVGLLATASLGGCSVAANLSADELLNEVDQIVRVEGAAPEFRIGYVERVSTSSWFRRMVGVWVFVVIEALVVTPIFDLLDGDDEDDPQDDASDVSFSMSDRIAQLPKLDMPVDHVRQLLLELPDEVGDDVRFAGLAASRFGWIAHYDVYPLSRIVALDGLLRVAAAMELPLFPGDLARHGFGPEAPELAAACARVRAQRPQRKGPAPTGDRSAYVADLGAVVAAPRQSAHDRIVLVETLTEALLAETDDAARAATVTALRAAYAHMVERLLIDLVQSRDLDDVDVRLCAMEHVRRCAGPMGVPFLLALMAADAGQLSRGEPQYDPDPLVRLRLIHYCGQLRGGLLDAVLALPGRNGGVPAAPADFLAVTALTETAFTSRLRTPAITALCWALQRPRVEHDLGWIREWRQGRR